MASGQRIASRAIGLLESGQNDRLCGMICEKECRFEFAFAIDLYVANTLASSIRGSRPLAHRPATVYHLGLIGKW